MIERTEYLDKLKSLREKKVIKIATGIRRCGKSTLYSQSLAWTRFGVLILEKKREKRVTQKQKKIL